MGAALHQQAALHQKAAALQEYAAALKGKAMVVLQEKAAVQPVRDRVPERPLVAAAMMMEVPT